MILVPSANIVDFEISLIMPGRSFIYRKKTMAQEWSPEGLLV
jgi:hypothetical protein